jgi:hypothetical protein
MKANCGHSREVKAEVRRVGVELQLVYRIVAARENETVSWERTSELIAFATARVFASEGWHVEITDDGGKTLDSTVFEAPASEYSAV